jgi:hypothetical protein
MSNKLVLWVGGALAALLITVVIVVIVLVSTLNAQAEHQAYRDCMARHGYAADAPASVTTQDELDAFSEGITAAAEACLR